MAFLLPLIKDIIPMVLPAPVHVTKSTDLDPGTETGTLAVTFAGTAATGQTDGMIRKAAIIGKSDKICTSVMIALPHSASTVHHHGEQDTTIYCVRGHGGSILTHDGTARHDLSPGDFALVPAWTEHQEVNDGDEEVEWVINRAPGGIPVVVNLKGWGGGRK